MSEQNKKSILKETIAMELLSKIDKICDSQKKGLILNPQRADAISKKMKEYGFREIGCGTNRIVFEHKRYNKYVFKIALDRRGIVDNESEYRLCRENILHPFVTKNYESNGLVSVAQKIETLTSFELDRYGDTMMKYLDFLKDYYILNDIGPKSFKNWGVDDNGKLLILDYAYLTRTNEVELRVCNKCNSALVYNDDLSKLVCSNKKCRKEFTFAEVSGGTYDPLLEMGFITKGNPPIDLDDNDIIDGDELEYNYETNLDGFLK